MTRNQIAQLSAMFGNVRTIQPEHFDRLKAALSPLPVRSLEKLADSDARFVNTAANSLLCDRGIRPESARLDHAAVMIHRNLTRKVGAA